MSGLAGIFKFAPRDRLDRGELMALVRGIDRIGPDGGREHLTFSLGMAYRAFHTTPGSHFEAQPLVRHDSVLTWDGRLDNREDVCLRAGHECIESIPDAELVFAAYEESGESCFAELIGDWALALWDDPRQQLILARDYIGARRLFYRLDEGAVAWCTTLEPLVLTAPQRLHLDPDYLNGCLHARPPIEATPYQEIRSVVPASYRVFRSGPSQRTEQYWTLNPHARICYSTDSEYEEHFRDLFRNSVRQRLRADRALLAELSGGVDSSSIVCTADEIRKEEPGPTIETLSYYNTDEPSGDERPYFALVEQKRGRAGHHISASDLAREAADQALAPLPDEYFSACPGHFAKSLRWESAVAEIQNRTGARVILSGIGGDEVLGGIQYEAPELAQYLLEGRLIPFAQSIYRWSLARKKTVFQLLGDTIRLLRCRHAPDSLHADRGPMPLGPHPTPRGCHAAFKAFARWKELSPAQLSLEWIRYSLAQQLTCTDPPLIGCAERRYPFLDRSLFVFLASIPRTQILQSGKRRYLMRRALRGLVPETVLFRKTKWFGNRSTLALLLNQRDAVEAVFGNERLADGIAFGALFVRKHLDAIQLGDANAASALYSAIGIELWLRSLVRRASVDLATARLPKIAP